MDAHILYPSLGYRRNPFFGSANNVREVMVEAVSCPRDPFSSGRSSCKAFSDSVSASLAVSFRCFVRAVQHGMITARTTARVSEGFKVSLLHVYLPRLDRSIWSYILFSGVPAFVEYDFWSDWRVNRPRCRCDLRHLFSYPFLFLRHSQSRSGVAYLVVIPIDILSGLEV